MLIFLKLFFNEKIAAGLLFSRVFLNEISCIFCAVKLVTIKYIYRERKYRFAASEFV